MINIKTVVVTIENDTPKYYPVEMESKNDVGIYCFYYSVAGKWMLH